MCGDGVFDANEECDDGGICVGGNNAGVPCTLEAHCQGQGVCDAFGVPGGGLREICNADADCGTARCVRCQPLGGDGCAANCTTERSISSTRVAGVADGTQVRPGTSGKVINAYIPTIPILRTSGFNRLPSFAVLACRTGK